MALEDLTGSKYINSLVSTNPEATDAVLQGDDHLRGIKNILKQTFAAISGAVTATHAQLDYVKRLPSSLSGAGLKVLGVNSGATAYEHVDVYTETEIDANHYTKTAIDAAFSPITRSRRNLIINGCMRISQRDISWAAVGNDWTLDRWKTAKSTTAVATIDQRAETTQTFAYYYRIDVTTADATIAAGDYWQTTTKVEGHDVAHLMWGTADAQDVTLTFKHAHTKTGTHCVAIRNDGSTRSYVAEYTQTVGDTWEESTITIPGDTSGTWLTDYQLGLQLTFAVICGTTFATATTDTWQGANYFASTNQVNSVDSTSNFWRIAEVQLEAASVGSDFERRPYQEELSLCQRYYEKSYNWNQYPGTSTSTAGVKRIWVADSTELDDILGLVSMFATPKRASPDVVWYGNTATAAKLHNVTLDTNAAVDSTIKTSQTSTGWPRMTSDRNRWDIFEGQWTADAEL